MHLALFPDMAEIVPGNEAGLEAEWEALLALRAKVLAKLEVLREQKVIGKSLEATVTLGSRAEGAALWERYASALPELFNVSEVEFRAAEHLEEDLHVQRSQQPKCERCWRFVGDVSGDARFPSVCLRCAEALEAVDFPPYAAADSESAA